MILIELSRLIKKAGVKSIKRLNLKDFINSKVNSVNLHPHIIRYIRDNIFNKGYYIYSQKNYSNQNGLHIKLIKNKLKY